MPPPSIAVKSMPRGNSFVGGMSRTSSTAAQPRSGDDGSSIVAQQSVELPPPQALPAVMTSPAHSMQSAATVGGGGGEIARNPDGGDDVRYHQGHVAQAASPSQQRSSMEQQHQQSYQPQLPSTHSPHMHPSSGAPAVIPSATSDPHAPGSGVFVKRKVKKTVSSAGDTPQPSDRRRSPNRSEGSSTPRVKSILRNPVARHGTVTFSADVVGITLSQVDSVPVLKKADIEQATMRDEVFSSLAGPVTSREQITVNITADDDGQGLRIEGIIDHLNNNDEQTAVIRRLADFLHSANVFGKSLAPFLTLGSGVGAADRTINDVTQRILLREARINDVPIKTVAPSAKSLGAAPGTPKAGSNANKTNGMSVTTPMWDPDYSFAAPPEESLAQARYEKRRKAYQMSVGIMHASPMSIPTPHNGRWERAVTEVYSVRPDPVDQGVPITERSLLVDTPHHSSSYAAASSSRQYTYVPHGVVESPPRTPRGGAQTTATSGYGATAYPQLNNSQSQSSTNPRIVRESVAPYSGVPSYQPAEKVHVYRTRQYVREPPLKTRNGY